MPLGALSICQVSNQLSGKLVNVHASEVIDLLSLEIEDGRPKDDRYVDATAVEYFSVHDLPPIEGTRGKGCACWAAIARQIALGLFPPRLLGRLLARVLREDMQERIRHGPYRLRAS